MDKYIFKCQIGRPKTTITIKQFLQFPLELIDPIELVYADEGEMTSYKWRFPIKWRGWYRQEVGIQNDIEWGHMQFPVDEETAKIMMKNNDPVPSKVLVQILANMNVRNTGLYCERGYNTINIKPIKKHEQ